jgi:hypothetical protein
MEIIAKLRGHLQFSQDLTGFQIYFSNEKGVSRVHGPMDRYFGWSTMDSQPGQGGVLDGARLLRRAGARCDEGKRERRATRFSPRASGTGEEAELSWQWFLLRR